MANEKLTWLELRKAVAQMAGVSEQEADAFLNAFVDAILNGLQLDKQVKIKGLGTFALKAVAPRKSINIATGEEFTIEGYNKLTFSAESMLDSFFYDDSIFICKRHNVSHCCKSHIF